ncbi:maltose ABC transporter permease MalF [Ideonella sp. A 288]|uniref:maltose ABC transporter permease MalF n=1 Tax=Ideonella sp. A 288 TaxID=1962181 RepID=UPI000B4ADD9B|nr:maltose ABC transporter permease MalF [Ideonella sp. A 288]
MTSARLAARPWFQWPLTALATLALLWAVFGLYAQGQPLWAVASLALGGAALYVYAGSPSLAWRYLFPGVAAMLLFVAFPLVYTVQIGFTNYSATHLLGEAQARAYLLEQAQVDEDRAMAFTLHADGADRVRLLLAPADEAPGARYLSPPLSLREAARDAAPVAMQVPPDGAPPLAAPLGLRQVIELRPGLASLALALPDGRVLRYAGLREFAPRVPLWRAGEGGAVVEAATGTVYTPDRDSGYFQSAQGERLQPGFKVGVGLANYARLFGDTDMRGPFVSIFIWTVLFSALTVLFSTALGMTLAVLLNWEALKYRTLYRTLLFLPYAVPGFISILVFKGLFNQNFGEINAILDAVFGVKPAWFADPTLAKVMLLIVNTWLGYPYIMVLCTGLIKAIPADLYEASAIAGARPLTNFFRITAPLIVKPLTPLLISAFAFNFNNFVLISLLTDGRPDYLNTKLPAGTTDILVSYTYRIAFTDAGANFGLAAAISTVIFGLVAVLSMINLRFTQGQEGAR